MEFLLDAGWSADRRVALSAYVQALHPSPRQAAFFTSFGGLTLRTDRGIAIDLFMREHLANPRGEVFNPVKIALAMLESLAELGIGIRNGIPLCDLPYAQDHTRIVVDEDLNFFAICEDEALFIGTGPWWALPVIYFAGGGSDMRLEAGRRITTYDGVFLFDLP